MEFEKCYVYQPGDERPAKRRRIEPQGLHQSWSNREDLFQQSWQKLDVATTKAFATVNAANNKRIHEFLEAAHQDIDNKHIPTGLILLEPGSSSRSRFLGGESLSAKIAGTHIVNLESNAAPNLKTALKSINRVAITSSDTSGPTEAFDDLDEDEQFVTESIAPQAKKPKTIKRRRLLAYDLQILREFVDRHAVTSLVIHLQDTEGFDGDVLSDLIEHLSYWRDRIPIVLLMNISTSVEMLEQLLRSNAMRILRSRLFPAATFEQELEALFIMMMRDRSAVTLGPTLLRLAAQRGSDYLQDIACTKAGLKYALMTAYFANPLTTLLEARSSGARTKQSLSADHYGALRNTASFKRIIEALLAEGDVTQARRLLSNDEVLEDCAVQHIHQGKLAIYNMYLVLTLVQHTQSQLPGSKEMSLVDLCIQGLAGTLRSSANLRGMFLAMRKAPVASLVRVLDVHKDQLPNISWHKQCQDDLRQLVQLLSTSTVEAQATGGAVNRKRGSRAAGDDHSLTVGDESGALTTSEVTTRICKQFESEVDRYLVNPKELPFHEVFLWDATSPYREVFMPKPRQAIERALGNPHDYLDCECCGVEASEVGRAEIAPTQPATAILYNLYQESGNLINAHDGWQAFQAVVGEEKDEGQTMALFQRSLAELKHLGMVKSTRKRVDHIAKVAWPGL